MVDKLVAEQGMTGNQIGGQYETFRYIGAPANTAQFAAFPELARSVVSANVSSPRYSDSPPRTRRSKKSHQLLRHGGFSKAL